MNKDFGQVIDLINHLSERISRLENMIQSEIRFDYPVNIRKQQDLSIITGTYKNLRCTIKRRYDEYYWTIRQGNHSLDKGKESYLKNALKSSNEALRKLVKSDSY